MFQIQCLRKGTTFHAIDLIFTYERPSKRTF